MRIAWFSNAPWSPTGYGNQTKVFLPRIQELGHELGVIAFYGLDGGALHWNGMPVYPKAFHPYGQDILAAHSMTFKADITISLLDAWVCTPENYPADVRWVPWFPVDSDPLPPPVKNSVDKAYTRIVFSKFAERMMKDAGFEDFYYVPHGVDTKVFKPMDMMEARNWLKWPADKFVIGMVAANKGNPSRKAFQQQIEAFAELKKEHSDVMMYLHTLMSKNGENQGVNLPQLIEHLGLTYSRVGHPGYESADVLFADQYMISSLGFGDDYMRAVYSAMDVHTLVTMGEGFGIPTIEAQACGCPVIGSGWTATGELVFSGWKIPKSEAEPVFTPLEAYQYTPHTGAILDAYKQAYRMKGNQEYRKAARKGAMQYDADKVTQKYWKPVLENIEQRVKDEPNHNWGKIGLYIENGKALAFPDLNKDNPSALIMRSDGSKEIVDSGFEEEINGVKLDIEDDPVGGVSKVIMREIRESYAFDDIPFEKGDIVIDIGAHVGIVSCYLAKKYGVYCIAYEPLQKNFDRLVRNVEANGLDGLVTPIHKAVTKDGRDVTISDISSTNSGGGNIYSAGDDVKSTTLARIIPSTGRIKLLKIDCEGAEYEVIEAFPELLKNVDYVRGEVHPIPGKDPKKLIELICKYVPKENVNLSILGQPKKEVKHERPARKIDNGNTTEPSNA